MDIQSLYQRWRDDLLTDVFYHDRQQLVTFDKFRSRFLSEADDLQNEGIIPDTLVSDDICDFYHNDIFTLDEYVFIMRHFLAS